MFFHLFVPDLLWVVIQSLSYWASAAQTCAQIVLGTKWILLYHKGWSGVIYVAEEAEKL